MTTDITSNYEELEPLVQKIGGKEDIFENRNNGYLLLDTSLWKQSSEERLSEDEETKNFINLDYSTSNNNNNTTSETSIGGEKPESLNQIFGSQLDETSYNSCLDVLFYPEDLFNPEPNLPSNEESHPPDFLSSSDATPASNIIDEMGDLPFVPLDNMDSMQNAHSEKSANPSSGSQSQLADVLLSLKTPVVHPDSPPISNAPIGAGSQSEAWQASGYQSPQFEDEHPHHPHLNDPCVSQYPLSYAEIPWTSPHQQSHEFFPTAMSVNVSMNMTVGVSPTHFSPYGYQESNVEPNTWNSQYGTTAGHCEYSSSSSSSSSSCSSAVRSQNLYLHGGSVCYGEHSGKEEDYQNKRNQYPFIGMRSGRYSFEDRKTLGDPSSPDSSTDTTKNVCGICGKTYARPSTLKTHMRTHSGERPYRCFDCDKSFSQAANLTAHCRTHSGEKPFHCSICNRKFSQSSSVTTHMRTHSGERPYRCRMCKKAFSDSSTLTKHLRIHSGEKPYQCKLCHLKFSQSGNLNRHMRIHAQNGR